MARKNIDLKLLETALKKRLDRPYSRGRVQNNQMDTNTDFIYKIRSYFALLDKIKDLDEGLQNYALNRWYNFWSAMGVEQIFATHKSVVPRENEYDKLVDFSIEGINFDHKTSVFPKGYGKDIIEAYNNKDDLIKRFYDNGSKERRLHHENKIFVVVYDRGGEHWKIKAEISLLKEKIDEYMSNFDKNKLSKIKLDNGKEVLSDIIRVAKPKK